MLFAVTAFSSLTAFAENTSLPPATGNLTIHKYIMDDLALANAPNDGNTTTNIPASAKPIAGIVFKLYKITIPADGTAPLDETAFVLNNYSNPTILTASDGKTFNLTAVSGANGTVTTNASGEATSTGLAQGLYLVVEQLNDKVVSICFPFIVAVPMTNATRDGWIQNVHVYPKNGDISISKAVDRTAVKLGEEVKWSVTISVPADIASFQQFDMTDALDTALDYKANSVVVTGLMTKTAPTGTTVAASNYTASVDAANKLTVSFNAAGRTALAAYKFIRVDFITTVNQNILARTAYTVKNKAKVEFKNKFDTNTRNRESNEVEIHTACIILEKINTHNNKPLEGAEFQIASSQANADNGRYIRKLTVNGKVKLVDYGETDYATATPWIEKSTLATSGTYAGKAIVKFEGLKEYTGVTPTAADYLTYWIVETKAPANFNLLAAPIIVKFDASKSNGANGYTICGIVVKNTNKFTLPKTGGTGTILFTAGGVTLIAIAAFLLVMSARKKKQGAR